MDEENVMRNYIDQLEIGRAQRYKNLAIRPLVYKGKKSVLEYKLVQEAIKDGSFQIKETGTVNKLQAYVKSDENILILKGEYVVGGKQNRMISVNGLIDKHEGSIDIPVHCIQQGRWSGAGEFDIGSIIVSPSIRGDVLKCYSGSEGQSKTWNLISAALEDTGVSSHSSDFNEIYNTKKEDIKNYMEPFSLVEDQVGFIVAVTNRYGNTSYYLDVFDQEKTLKKNAERLLTSYATEAMRHQETIRSEKRYASEFSRENAEKFLEEIADSDMKASRSISLGKDVELKNGKITGSGLVYDNTAVYIGAKKEIFMPCPMPTPIWPISPLRRRPEIKRDPDYPDIFDDDGKIICF